MAEVTKEEVIVVVIKSMHKNKSPGTDGFSSELFMAAWDVVREQMVETILEFFRT